MFIVVLKIGIGESTAHKRIWNVLVKIIYNKLYWRWMQ